MTRNADLLARRNRAVARGVANMHDIYAVRAENAEVWDVDGRRYIDFAGGIGVLNTGHRHPKVMAAVQHQLAQYTHTCFRAALRTLCGAGRAAEHTGAGWRSQEDAVSDHRRRGRRERSQDRARLHRSASDHRVQWGLPRAHDDDAGPDRQGISYKTGFGPFRRYLPRAFSDRGARYIGGAVAGGDRQSPQSRCGAIAGRSDYRRAGAGEGVLWHRRVSPAPACTVRCTWHPAD